LFAIGKKVMLVVDPDESQEKLVNSLGVKNVVIYFLFFGC